MLTLKRAQFGFEPPSRFVTLATMFNPAPAALPVVGIANQQLYRRHCPEQTALYPVIETNLTPFLEHLQERDATLPRFVTAEFKEYLRCGRLEYGFIWVSSQRLTSRCAAVTAIEITKISANTATCTSTPCTDRASSASNNARFQ